MICEKILANRIEYPVYRETLIELSQYKSRVNGGTQRTYTYIYDNAGNITEVINSQGYTYEYDYDEYGQLIRENNSALNRTFVYTYDHAGNITSKKTYTYTTATVQPSAANLLSTDTYTYGDVYWADQLTAYNGTTIAYDTIGNPTAIGSATLTWHGRQLMQYVNGTNTYSYTYTDAGIRTSKTINGVTHTYHLSGSQIVAEEWGNNLLVYLYDAEGAPLGMQYRNTTYAEGVFDTYWFEKNMQGDIVAVYNDSGTLLISYLYDAWGNVTTTYSNGGASTNAVYNPFKYRGYYHDSETGWYYLQSRYYTPTWGRFINADSVMPGVGTSVHGYNLFAYSFNDPINLLDSTGHWPHFLNNIAQKVGGAIAKVQATLSIVLTAKKIAIASIIAVASGNASVEDVLTDAKNYDFYNTDESKVIVSEVFSSYNGTPVLKQNLSGGSMSVFNTIFLSKYDRDVETVKHEWGHTVQQSLMGTPKYMTRIAIPSLIGAAIGVEDYFSQPWERSADFFGGATHSYSKNSEVWGTLYYYYALILGRVN